MKANNVNSMNPLNSRDSVAKISMAVLSFSGKDILLVEGKRDKNLYNKIITKLGKKNNIYVLPVHGKGQYLDVQDANMLGRKNNVSAKLSIILLVKRCFAREWAGKVLLNTFYGIVDKDFFFDEELEFVNDSLLENPRTTPMSDEDWKAYFCDVVNNGRLVTTDTNDVETLIFNFDFKAVTQSCKFASKSEDEFLKIREKALKTACKKLNYQKEKNYNNGYIYNEDTLELESFSRIGWEYCKGHVLVTEFLNLIDMEKLHFRNEDMFMDSVINCIHVSKFEKTKVYRFIETI